MSPGNVFPLSRMALERSWQRLGTAIHPRPYLCRTAVRERARTGERQSSAGWMCIAEQWICIACRPWIRHADFHGLTDSGGQSIVRTCALHDHLGICGGEDEYAMASSLRRLDPASPSSISLSSFVRIVVDSSRYLIHPHTHSSPSSVARNPPSIKDRRRLRACGGRAAMIFALPFPRHSPPAVARSKMSVSMWSDPLCGIVPHLLRCGFLMRDDRRGMACEGLSLMVERCPPAPLVVRGCRSRFHPRNGHELVMSQGRVARAGLDDRSPAESFMRVCMRRAR